MQTLTTPRLSGHGRSHQIARAATTLLPAQRTPRAAEPWLARLRQGGAWFAGSAAADATGSPITLYHGTSADFESFQDNARGIWLAESAQQASLFADIRRGAPRVLALHASIRRPWVLIRYGQDFPYSQMLDQSVPALKALGYDGLYRPEDRAWVAFEPRQVRSAITPEPEERSQWPGWAPRSPAHALCDGPALEMEPLSDDAGESDDDRWPRVAGCRSTASRPTPEISGAKHPID